MELRHYMTCFWPGLPELWWRGRLSSLPAAIGFGVAFNLILVTRFIYPEWFSGVLVKLTMWIGIAAWLFWSVKSIQELPLLLAPRTVSDEPDHFADARDAFLRGEWHEAEGLLTDILAIESRDPPALLLLAGVYRRTGRLEAAQSLIQEISRLEAADGWWLERLAEEKRLDIAIARAADETEAENVETDVNAETNAADSESVRDSTDAATDGKTSDEQTTDQHNDLRSGPVTKDSAKATEVNADIRDEEFFDSTAELTDTKSKAA